ncbi:PREDICTED: uncharacterized protein LOC105453587 isoform X2 [Wasmannia auropunctata]|uniref:uncharacterized protein LOC105453587 isoform X2 n=1 Tax=Wasmannia auropunctata TaxID=64793 RepID=UPI0005F03056|nr:PREDICTED: uncharacterized protein LOC105453587 isoform X2 [Wasmannia auropunctata]
MINRHRILLLILCSAATIHGILLNANDAETCNLLCIQCNASAVFANGHCECNFADDSDKVSGAECIQRVQRDIEAIELNMLSEDLTDEERDVRSIFKYRRRLRPGDAEKVAQYFINGGPAAGHSHFVKMFNATRDSAESATNSFSGVVDENSASYVGPTMEGVEKFTLASPLRALNPAIAYPTSRVYDPLLGSIVHHPHPHGLPHVLLRAATLPAHVLHNVLHPRAYHRPMYHHGIVRSANDGSDTSIGQSCENDDSTTANFPTARSNADKPAEQNVGLTDSPQYPGTYLTSALYQPLQYQNVPYQYSYYSPLLGLFQPNGYVLQTVPPYTQDTSDPMTAASNSYFCKKNANGEQRSGADRTTLSNDGTEKSVINSNSIAKEDKSTEKN